MNRSRSGFNIQSSGKKRDPEPSELPFTSQSEMIPEKSIVNVVYRDV